MLMMSLLGLPALAGTASAHPGGTNAAGCHAGTQPYHCHGSTPSRPPVPLPVATPVAPPVATPVAATCADFPTQQAAQAAFDADRTSRSDLDRDGDGLACEAGDSAPATTPPVVTPLPVVTRNVTIGIRQASGIYTFSGVLTPAEAGRQVTVARLDSVTKRVTGVASTLTDAAGRYVIRTRLPVGFAGFYTLTATHGRSRLYGLIVPGQSEAAPAACSARSTRVSHTNSVDCMFRAYKRGDWAAVANYALPPVIAQLRQSRPYDVRTGFPYSFHGCREPQYAEFASSGIACEFYSHPTPGDGMIHGVVVEFSMDRYFRAESITNIG